MFFGWKYMNFAPGSSVTPVPNFVTSRPNVAPDKRMLGSVQIIPVLHQCLAFMVFFAVAGLFVGNVLLISNRDTDGVYHFIKYFSRNVPHHYVRPTENSCELHRISLKYIPECGLDSQLSPRYIKPLLIVGVQRSGTHYMWEMLQILGIDVHHEGVGPDGSVSWLYAVNSHYNSTPFVEDIGRGYVINNPEALYMNRFRHIFHQVRHPLRVITTLQRRCAAWDPIWAWIHSLRGFEEIQESQTPLHRAMLLYLLWNRHIERYADLRYQSEVTTAEEVCIWAGFGERCRGNTTTAMVTPPPLPPPPHLRAVASSKMTNRELTWDELTAENATLSLQLKHMCLSYGYALDPARTPQREETRIYTA